MNTENSYPDELPSTIRAALCAARSDIDLIHCDDAFVEADQSGGGEVLWVVPVEARFSAEDDGVLPGEAGWHHGNMQVTVGAGDELVDHYVGDWSLGMHPDLHTFER